MKFKEALPNTELTLGETLRNQAFWILDKLKGSPIASEIQDIHEQMQNPVVRKERRQRRLEQLLTRATEHVPYYHAFNDFNQLSDFPILTKEILKTQFDAFMSSQYRLDELIAMSTTGSYGTPFTFYLSPQKRYRQLAEIIYFSGWAGYRIGMRYAQMRGTKHSFWKSFTQNEVLMNPWLIDQNWLWEKRNILLKDRIRFLFEYPSPMVHLAEYCRLQKDHPGKFDIRGIVTSSETLTDAMRHSLEKTFGGTVLSRYSSQENGVIAHDHPQFGSKMLVNEAGHVIEFLKLNVDEPASPGELSRVVVTDLYSDAMPLIRYDIGDTAVYSDSLKNPYGVAMIERLEGRIIETIYSTGGDVVSPYLVVTGLWGIEGIIQCQFIQKTEDTYLMKMIVQDTFCGENEILKRFHPIVGADAKIHFEYTDHIEPLPSGKRPQVLNEWKSQ